MKQLLANQTENGLGDSIEWNGGRGWFRVRFNQGSGKVRLRFKCKGDTETDVLSGTELTATAQVVFVAPKCEVTPELIDADGADVDAWTTKVTGL